QRDRWRARADRGRLVAAARLQHPGGPGRARRSPRRSRPRPSHGADPPPPRSRRRPAPRLLTRAHPPRARRAGGDGCVRWTGCPPHTRVELIPSFRPPPGHVAGHTRELARPDLHLRGQPRPAVSSPGRQLPRPPTTRERPASRRRRASITTVEPRPGAI